MRGIYKAKHDAFLNEAKLLEKDFQISGEYAGLHILLTDRRGRTEAELIEKARQAGVKVYGLSQYFIEEYQGRPATIVAGYARLSEEEILRGAEL